MRKAVVFILIVIPMVLSNCSTGNQEKKVKESGSGNGVIQLTEANFKKNIYNYDAGKSWEYAGKLPAIIDFYADWCPPCRQLSPLVEEVAKEYQGKILVYRVNTDQEKILAQSLGITNLPTLLYIPSEGMPKASMGWIPKDTLVKTINEFLLTR